MATGILTLHGSALGAMAAGTPVPPVDPPDDPPDDVTPFSVTSSSMTPNPVPAGSQITWTIDGTPRSDGANPVVGTVRDSDGRAWSAVSITPNQVVLRATVTA